jgi:hypothetical protein
LTLVLVVVAAAERSSACSICRCGDPVFNSLGLNIYASGAWRVALDWDHLSKEQGIWEEEGHAAALDVEGDRESIVEQRVTATVAATLGERLALMARVPMSQRVLETEAGHAGALSARAMHTETGSTDSDGLADPELVALVRIWGSPFRGDLGRRAWVAAQIGVKTSWGENDLASGGERLDEHLQPGTGAPDWTGGLSTVVVLDQRSTMFASAAYRQTGTNDYDYRYGPAALAALGFERKLGKRVSAVVELDYRDSERDVVDADSTHDPNTGGRIVYFTPRLAWALSPQLVGRFAAQLPVSEKLYGEQDEGPVFTVGLSVLVGD